MDIVNNCICIYHGYHHRYGYSQRPYINCTELVYQVCEKNVKLSQIEILALCNKKKEDICTLELSKIFDKYIVDKDAFMDLYSNLNNFGKSMLFCNLKIFTQGIFNDFMNLDMDDSLHINKNMKYTVIKSFLNNGCNITSDYFKQLIKTYIPDTDMKNLFHTIFDYNYVPDIDDIIQLAKRGISIENIDKYNIDYKTNKDLYMAFIMRNTFKIPYKMDIQPDIDMLKSVLSDGGYTLVTIKFLTKKLIPDRECLKLAYDKYNNIPVIKYLMKKGNLKLDDELKKEIVKKYCDKIYDLIFDQ